MSQSTDFAVSFSLRQTAVIVDGPSYRVKNEIVSAVNANVAIFVFKAVTKSFDHYAVAADMVLWPDSYDASLQQGLPFYRQTAVTRDWMSIEEMNADLQLTQQRINFLAAELNAQRTVFPLDQTVVLTGTV